MVVTWRKCERNMKKVCLYYNRIKWLLGKLFDESENKLSIRSRFRL